MRVIAVIAVLAALLPSQLHAADLCGPPEASSQIQMIRSGYADLVPVTVNGLAKNFLFDTGGYFTQVSRQVADELKLPITQGNSQISDAAGRVSRDRAWIGEFIVGNRRAADLQFPVSPVALPIDGILALDHWTTFDLDVDFGTDMLTISPQGCAAAVRQASAAAVIPITMQGYHVYIPVTLDGHELSAAIDTGQNVSSVSTDIARLLFDLDLGSEQTPEAGGLNGDASIKVYTHIFNSLVMGGLIVRDPRMVVVPDVRRDDARIAPPRGDPTRMEEISLRKPGVIIGMDVLRRLHITFAFGEKKMYVSMASTSVQTEPPRAMTTEEMAAAPRPEVQSAYKKSMAQRIAELDHQLASDPGNVQALSGRCFARATVRANLDAALADCDQAIRLMPADAHIREVRAFVLYQQGDYRQALEAYDTMLAAGPPIASALFMRGNAKGKLGDSAGKDADIAAAKAIQPNIELVFKPFDMSE
jgi:predicted aspartyl protease